jgi:hypothetical protein
MPVSPRAPVQAKKNTFQTMAGLRPEQIAFLGEYAASAEDKNVFVQILCWPTIPAAWSMLTQSLDSLRKLRRELAGPSAALGSSWLQRVAPQLSTPVERELGAAESTLATLIRRLPVRFAVAVVEHEAGQASGSETARYRSLFSGCLGAYGAYLKSTNQSACRVMIASSQNTASDTGQRTVYQELLPLLDNADRLATLELAFWPEAPLPLPLPLEVAQLAAASVGRHLQHPKQANPLFETVRAHLAPPSRFHVLSRKPRRK